MSELHLHLVSDSSGETVSTIVRACLSQFEGISVCQHIHTMVRNNGRAMRVVEDVVRKPGPVFYSLVDPDIRAFLEGRFAEFQIVHTPVLDPVLSTLSRVLQKPARGAPGRQHTMDDEYFRRIDAMNFTIEHDDGQSMESLHEADVIVFGVSRTSKTPMCMYLANRGLRSINIPVVKGIPLPQQALQIVGPLKVGLTREPRSLTDIRRNRLRLMNDRQNMTYADETMVREEVLEARKLFLRLGYPVIDVTRKSIEEAAAVIIQLHIDHQRQKAASAV